MEDKIQTLEQYLKEPTRAIKNNYSLLVSLQEILHMREHGHSYSSFDRRIYELFHLTMSLFLQPIDGYNAWIDSRDHNVLFRADVDENGRYCNPDDQKKETKVLLLKN